MGTVVLYVFIDLLYVAFYRMKIMGAILFSMLFSYSKPSIHQPYELYVRFHIRWPYIQWISTVCLLPYENNMENSIAPIIFIRLALSSTYIRVWRQLYENKLCRNIPGFFFHGFLEGWGGIFLRYIEFFLPNPWVFLGFAWVFWDLLEFFLEICWVLQKLIDFFGKIVRFIVFWCL